MTSVLTHFRDDSSRDARSAKEFAVIVDLEALAYLERRATAPDDHLEGISNRCPRTVAQKSESRASTSNDGAPEGSGPASLAPIQDEPNALTPVIVEQARLRIK